MRSSAFRAAAEMKIKPAEAMLNTFASKPHATAVRAAAIEALCILDTQAAARHAADLFSGAGRESF